MVVPIIAGGVLLGYITYGKELLGKKTFDLILKGLIVGVVIFVGYIGYKLYKLQKKGEETVEDIKDVIDDILKRPKKAKEETERVLESDERYEDLEGIEEDVIYSGEYVSQLFGGSAYSAGKTTAQKSYDSFEKRYDTSTAEFYEDLPGSSRGLVSLGDYITGGRATDAGYKFGNWLKKIKGD